MKKILLCSLVLSLCPSLVFGQPPLRGSDGFYNRDAEGWFWYVDPEREIVEKPEPPKPKPDVKSNDGKIKKDGPPALSSAWFRENLPKYRDLAVDVPTQDNVAAYFYLQRYAMDKAQKFAEMAQMVVATDPLLDENTRRPLASFGSGQATRQASLNQDAVMSKISKTAGILFFYHSECKFCEIQAPVLESLERNFGVTVKAISLDAKPLKTGLYKNFSVDKGQAKKLGVLGTPAMFLFTEDSKVVPISQGVLSQSEIVDRVVGVASTVGLVSSEEYSATKTARDDLQMDTSINAALGLTEFQERDTAEMVKFMRGLFASGMSTKLPTSIKNEAPKQ